MSQRLLRASLLLLAACGSATSEGTPTTPAPAEPDPWAMLEQWGELDEARAIFTEWREGERAAEGTVGLMTVAEVEGDRERLAELTESLDVEALETPDLIARAALAAGDLRPVPLAALSLGQRACAIAEADPEDDALRLQAREACAFARLAASAEGQLDVCVAGCDTTQELPILLAGTSPVARVSVNGSEPTPFIVDTGASGMLITRGFAEAHGIEPVEGTSYEVGAAGGLVETSMARVDVAIGDLRLEGVPTVILELPIEFVGGIVSPQATWRGRVTELDFRALTLRVMPSAGDTAGLSELPLRLTDGTPYVRLAAAGRRAVPMVLDTGATQTMLFTSWEELEGEPIQRGPETRVAGAGGSGARAWIVPTTLQASAGPLDWSMFQPVIVERGDEEVGQVRFRGLVGMDLLIGRRMQLDLPARAVRVSEEQRLGDWARGAAATYRIRAAEWDEDVVLTERVVDRQTSPSGVELVMVDVSYTGEKQGHFRYAMPDMWPTRGTWLVSRPAAQLWDVADDGGMSPVPPAERSRRWLPVFVPFQGRPGGNPDIRFVPREREGQEPLSCTEISVPAATQTEDEATLEIVECPTEAWRTQRLTLRGPDETVIYEFIVEDGAPEPSDGENAESVEGDPESNGSEASSPSSRQQRPGADFAEDPI